MKRPNSFSDGTQKKHSSRKYKRYFHDMSMAIISQQILRERGLYKPKRHGRQTQSVKDKHELLGHHHKIVPPDLDAHAVLSSCPDFAFERTALQNVIETRGHILLHSVVCTPETAGGGIEYAWGKLKFEQSRQALNGATKLESGVKFIERVSRLHKTLPFIAEQRRFYGTFLF